MLLRDNLEAIQYYVMEDDPLALVQNIALHKRQRK